MLDAGIVASEQSHPYIQLLTYHRPPSDISRAPCHGRTCILETSIKLLPESTSSVSVTSARSILEIEKERLKDLGEKRAINYINFAPSNAVDGDPKTVFCSLESEFAF